MTGDAGSKNIRTAVAGIGGQRISRRLQKERIDGFTGTDESSLVERLEIEVSVVPGSDRNIKITKPADMDLAHLYLQAETARS